MFWFTSFPICESKRPFLFCYNRVAVSGVLDCGAIVLQFWIAKGLWNQWSLLDCCIHVLHMVWWSNKFTSVSVLIWYGFFLLQSVRSWSIVAIMCISLQSYRLPQGCLKSRIQLQLSGLQILRSRLREDCDNLKELILGIAGHWEDCWGPLSMCLWV